MIILKNSEFEKWLVQNEDKIYNQFLIETTGLKIIDFIPFVFELYNVPKYLYLNTEEKFKKRGGSNIIAICRGHIVHYTLNNKIEGYSEHNIYEKLFNIKKDRCTALRWKYKEVEDFDPREKQKYLKMVELIKSYNIIWN